MLVEEEGEEREGFRLRIGGGGGTGAVKEREDDVAEAAEGLPTPVRIVWRKGAGFERTCMLVGRLSARGA